MIQSVGARGIAAQDTTAARDAQDDAAPGAFAGILAGVMNAAAPAIDAKQKPTGTSELDGKGDDDAPDGTASTSGSTSDPKAGTSATTATTSVTDVVRSIAALDPQLQAKLARVMDRMRAETGHDVHVVETYRSQARQNALYEQGRETPGPVVTWTQSSKHTQGRAVDVTLDGGAAGPDAYAALQRIAREEGLRTLGARDPGHLELSGTTGAANDASASIPNRPVDATAQGDGRVPITNLSKFAQVSRVAAVATTAAVAQPARVANVAKPTSATAVAPVNDSKSHTSGGGARSDTSDRGASGQPQARTPYSALGTTIAARGSTTFTPAATGSDVGSTAAARAEKILAALDSAPARPVTQITMAVDTGSGASDRVQVAMRGSAVNTTIDAADPRAAQAMSTRADELVRALNRDGIEVDSLRVRAASTGASTVVQAGQNGSGPSMNSRFERGSAWDQSRQRSQDGRRQHNREQREQRGGRKQ